MSNYNTAAFGIFTTRNSAEMAVSALLAAGFSNDDISMLASDPNTTKELATEKNTKAPEGATGGALTGGAIGGVLGALAGIGALTIPGVGPLIAAGPIMSAMAGIGAGAAAGGLVGALAGMGVPEYEAKRYEGRVREGGILVSAHCDSSEEVTRAKDVLKNSGGSDIASANEEPMKKAS